MQDSQLAGGPGGVGDLRATDKHGKQFGDLPKKLRDRILQSRNEGFPAGYESILKSYYKRLAAQRLAKREKPDAAPKAPGNGSRKSRPPAPEKKPKDR